MKRLRLTPAQFIMVWQAATSVKEVAEKTGSKVGSCSGKAKYYRKKGVPLKLFPKGRRTKQTLDWAALTKLAEECLS